MKTIDGDSNKLELSIADRFQSSSQYEPTPAIKPEISTGAAGVGKL